MDVAARETGEAKADGEIVWFRCLRVGVKFAESFFVDDGDKQIQIAGEITYKP